MSEWIRVEEAIRIVEMIGICATSVETAQAVLVETFRRVARSEKPITNDEEISYSEAANILRNISESGLSRETEAALKGEDQVAIDGLCRVRRGKADRERSEQLTRKCKRFFCVRMGAQLCCTDCARMRSGQCIFPCLNSPERCGLVEDISDE